MNRFVGVFLIGLLVVCQAQLSKTRSSDCGDNETYQTCGTACEPSCDTPSPSICTLQCVVGCQCDDGYVRNSKDQCVLYEQCTATTATNSSTPNLQQVITSTTSPFKCAANETYSDCHNPCTEAKCPTEGTTVAVACIAMCMQGCSCNSGYVRNNVGQCVESADCASTSANPCELVDCRFGMTCETQNGKAVCVPVKPQSLTCASTLCMNGYRCVDRIGKPRCVRAAENVPSITCSNVRCGTPGGCAMVEPTGCSGEDCVAQPMCIHENRCHYTKCASTTECVLKQVTCIRAPCNPIAECVPKKVQKRSSECPINERMVPCRNPCSEQVCNQKEELMCTQQCLYDGCACEANFYRHPNGTCVDQKECDKLGTGVL